LSLDWYMYLVPPALPTPRGELTECLVTRLRQRPGRLPHLRLPRDGLQVNEDLQLALHLSFGLHYDGFEGVADGWEWEPSFLELRARMVNEFLAFLIAETPSTWRPGAPITAATIQPTFEDVLASGAGASLSAHMVEHGTVEELREFLIHRSIYQLKEADPHTWAIPRLRSRAKAAMVTLQHDEYGEGVAGRSHAELFANTMADLDLDPTPGAYLDLVPGVSLATDNLVSALGLQRRWRGALVGHLAAFEMTSVRSMARYSSAIAKLGLPERAAEFYDVHVAADRLHAEIAKDDLLLGLAESDPKAIVDAPFGAAALLAVEWRFSAHLLDAWQHQRSSLLVSAPQRPKPQPDVALARPKIPAA